MPTLQSMILTDRTPGTPVAHTFTPKGLNGGVGIVTDKSGGVPFGEPRFAIGNRETQDRINTDVKFSVPVLATESINGVSRPIVLRSAYVTARFSFSRLSTEQERNDVVGMFASAFAPGVTLVNDVVVKAEGVYGA